MERELKARITNTQQEIKRLADDLTITALYNMNLHSSKVKELISGILEDELLAKNTNYDFLRNLYPIQNQLGRNIAAILRDNKFSYKEDPATNKTTFSHTTEQLRKLLSIEFIQNYKLPSEPQNKPEAIRTLSPVNWLPRFLHI